MMKLRTVILSLIVTTFLCAFSAGQAHAIMLVSQKMEISIGKDVAKQAEQEMGGVCTDKKLNARVEGVGKRLVEVCDRKKLPYTFKILNTKELNAFACPGGPVYITRGLLDKLDSDDELAFVLGHEVGHISRQHGRKAINKALTVNIIAGLFMPDNQVLQQGVGIAWTLVDRGYSRSQEYEADKMGTLYAMKAGFRGSGAVEALQVLQKESGSGKSSGLNKMLATHPPIPDRIERINKILAETESEQDRAAKS